MIDRTTTNGTFTADDAARALLRALRAAAEPPTLLLTPRDAAKALAVSEKTLWSLTVPRGTIPKVPVGERSIRYSVAALQRWIDADQTAAVETNGSGIENRGTGARLAPVGG